jgi:hypothetical protein
LCPKACPDFIDQLGTAQRSRVDTDLVRARVEEGCSVFESPYAAAYGERNKDFPGGAADCIKQCATALVCGCDIEEDDFVRARFGMTGGEFGRIAGVDEIHELHPLHDAAGGYVKACDDPPSQHDSPTKLRSICNPTGPDFSGWN